ncbi:ATP-binding protein [Pseudomonas mucidolens]|uniref:hybrid sensor histidine kinase/response regulator n=1 Tax=Pseudomonas mucidolens TaxID=46679 RepID=UPI0030D97DC0
MTFWIRLLLLFIGGMGAGQAAPTVVDACRSDHQALTPSAQVLQDTGGQLTAAQVLAVPGERFHPMDTWARPDYSGAAFWLRLTLRNAASGSCTQWLTVGEPRLQNIQMHVLRASGEQVLRAGADYPLDQWPMPFRQPVFPLQLQEGEQVTLLIRIASDSLLLIDPQLWSDRGLLETRQYVDLVDGIALGIVFVFVPFSLLVGWIVRSQLLRVHAGLLLSYILLTCATNGYLTFWPAASLLTPQIFTFFSIVSFAFFLGYARVLLQVRRLPKILGWLFSLQLVGFAASRLWGLGIDAQDGAKASLVFLYGIYVILPLTLAIGVRKGITFNPMAWIVVFLFGVQFVTRYVLTLYQLPWQAQANRHDLSSAIPGIVLLVCTLVVEVSRGRTRERRALADLESQQQAEHQRLENTVALRTQQLNDSLQARSSLMARISHDLRSPLVTIIDYARMLASDPVRAEHYSHRIENSARHQLELIDELLEFSRSELQQLELSLAAGYLYRFLQQVEEDGRLLASRQDNLFVCRFAEDLPALVRADYRRLRQVLINLLANASKFTRHGCITLEVTHQAGSDVQRARLRFSVTDTGIGVDSAELDHILEPFRRGSNAGHYEGSGLGLSIVSQLLAHMGSTLELQSEAQRGSCFSFSLELELADEDELDSVSEQNNWLTFDGEGTRILVVDDVELNRDWLYDFLTGYGVDVAVAENGERALALVDTGSFDLVMTDQAMPVMDGWALLRRLRAQRPELPVLLYSSAPPRRPVGYPQTLDFDASLLKPASGNELIAGIQALIQHTLTERQNSVHEQ